ncbi:hypothetical protein BD414DRAFT_493509 [Trametes punicea]|nr:hypothetical protein BD414DRAFT_493509 [Trametes punicea]
MRLTILWCHELASARSLLTHPAVRVRLVWTTFRSGLLMSWTSSLASNTLCACGSVGLNPIGGDSDTDLTITQVDAVVLRRAQVVGNRGSATEAYGEGCG